MAEMLIQSESLTAIADKIRVLSGTEDTMSLNAMESHVGEANTNVDTEADLIAQISSALEGKAGGGGGLPSGVSALTFGTFTPTSDCTSNWPIYHDLGQAPNFFIFYARDTYAAVSDFTGCCYMQTAMPRRVVNNNAEYSISFVTNNNLLQTISSTTKLSTALASNLFVVDAASSRKLKGGVTYNWMCGVIDMED